MGNPYEAYIKTDVATASPVKQIVMLYERAILALKGAIEDIKNNNIKSKVNNIQKATDILLALNSSLDMEKGKEIARNLRDLYDFSYQQILLAHAKNDIKLLEDIIEILETLKSAWEEIESKI
ncbi:MAG: flagellar export chaperone FliS [Aquificota bacterium]|nr:MAG: flagellar export chaperone FliS [Aquificota bacterium]